MSEHSIPPAPASLSGFPEEPAITSEVHLPAGARRARVSDIPGLTCSNPIVTLVRISAGDDA